jgi:putative ABC transport system permease protein
MQPANTRPAGTLIGIGLLVGLAMSLRSAKFVGALIYGLPPGDPATLVTAAALLTAVAGLAAWLPARRAVQADPAAVLRES